MSAIAATATSNYAGSHAGVTARSPVALDHGFQVALYGLTGMLLLGALIAVTLVRSAPAPSAQPAVVDGEAVVLEEAA
jgi:hypothetical protein